MTTCQDLLLKFVTILHSPPEIYVIYGQCVTQESRKINLILLLHLGLNTFLKKEKCNILPYKAYLSIQAAIMRF